MFRGISKFLLCPGCGKRGVHLRRGAEDWWRCRYCADDPDGPMWSACVTGEAQADRIGRRDLAAANPETVIWVTDLPDWPIPTEAQYRAEAGR